ncbi:MAG: MliC family protein [Gammaproteobacteria bacterium]|nr:MliC family protein [Gammaproteobacteria bacterium]
MTFLFKNAMKNTGFDVAFGFSRCVTLFGTAFLIFGCSQEQPALDLSATTSHQFGCGDAGPVEFRFLGPDTIEVTAGNDRFIMQHQRAASGARYLGDGAEFWNKGDEALLIVGDRRFECRRIGD